MPRERTALRLTANLTAQRRATREADLTNHPPAERRSRMRRGSCGRGAASSAEHQPQPSDEATPPARRESLSNDTYPAGTPCKVLCHSEGTLVNRQWRVFKTASPQGRVSRTIGDGGGHERVAGG